MPSPRASKRRSQASTRLVEVGLLESEEYSRKAEGGVGSAEARTRWVCVACGRTLQDLRLGGELNATGLAAHMLERCQAVAARPDLLAKARSLLGAASSKRAAAEKAREGTAGDETNGVGGRRLAEAQSEGGGRGPAQPLGMQDAAPPEKRKRGGPKSQVQPPAAVPPAEASTDAECNGDNAAVCRFLVGVGLPLSTVASPCFLEFMRSLRPSYMPTSPSWFRSAGLDELHATVKHRVEGLWGTRDPLTLTGDGFYGVGSDSILSFSERSRGKAAFKASCRALLPGGEPVRVGEQFLAQLSTRPPQQWVCVTADNMGGMRDVLFEVVARPEYQHLITLGCAAHTLRSLLDDYGEIFTSVLSEVEDVVLFVLSHEAVNSLLDKARSRDRGMKLHAGSNTREWGACLMCESLLANRAALEAVCRDESFTTAACDTKGAALPSRDVFLACVMTAQWWEQVESVFGLLKPVREAIDFVESDKVSIGSIFPLFSAIAVELAKWNSSALGVDREGAAAEKFNQCWRGTGGISRAPLYSPVHAAAFFLHPYMFDMPGMETFEAQHLADVKAAFRQNVNDDAELSLMLEQFQMFRANDGINFEQPMAEARSAVKLRFTKRQQAACGNCARTLRSTEEVILFSECAGDPIVWWKLWGKPFPGLQAAAIRILSAAATSVPIDRHHGVSRMLPTPALRATLYHERVQKLLYVHINLRLLNKLDAPSSQLFEDALRDALQLQLPDPLP